MSEENPLDRDEKGIEQTVVPEMDEKEISMEVNGSGRMMLPKEDPTKPSRDDEKSLKSMQKATILDKGRVELPATDENIPETDVQSIRISAEETDSGDLQEVVTDQLRDEIQEEKGDESLPRVSGPGTEEQEKEDENEATLVESGERNMEKSDTETETFPIVDAELPEEPTQINMKESQGLRVEKEVTEKIIESPDNDASGKLDGLSSKPHKACDCKVL